MNDGVTLMELLIATLMISLVFVASTSVYVSALKFLNTLELNSTQLTPSIVMEDMVKVVQRANQCVIANGGKNIDIRGDYPASADGKTQLATSLNTPNNFADDSWLHYKICNGPQGNGELHAAATLQQNNGPSCGQGNESIIMGGLTANTSSFAAIYPSGPSNPYNGVLVWPTVIKIHMTTNNPVANLETSVMIGAKSKRQ